MTMEILRLFPNTFLRPAQILTLVFNCILACNVKGLDWHGPRQHPTAGAPLSLFCGVPEGSFLLPLSCGKTVVTAASVPTRAPGRGGAGGQDVLPGPVPHLTSSRQGCYCLCSTVLAFEVCLAGSRPPVLSRQSWWGGERGLGQVQAASGPFHLLSPSLCSTGLLPCL